MRRKGVFGSVVTFVVFTVLIMGGSLLSMGHSAKVSEDFNDQIDDITHSSRALSYGDYLEKSYLPKSLNLSEHRAAHTLAENNGEYTFSDDNLPISNIKQDSREKLAQKTKQITNNYLDEYEKIVTARIKGGYTLEMNDKAELTPQNFGLTFNADDFSATYDITGERKFERAVPEYEKLAEDSHEVALELQTELDDNAETGEGSSTSSCHVDGDPSSADKDDVDSSAKSNARSDAKSDYKEGKDISATVVNTPVTDDFSPSYESTDWSFSNTWKKSSGEDSCTKVVKCPENGCAPDMTCQKVNGEKKCTKSGTEYSSTYKATLSKVKVNYLIDANRKVLTQDGAQQLEFSSTYVQPLE